MSLPSNNAVDGATQNSLLCENYHNRIDVQGTESERRNAEKRVWQNEPSLTTVLFSNEVIIGMVGLFTAWGLFTKRLETLSFTAGFLISYGAMSISEKITDVINNPLQALFPSSNDENLELG